MHIRLQSYLSLFTLLFLATIGCKKEIPPKPNILFIAVDDLRPLLGCYGDEVAVTPNLDRLAKSGIVFTHHYATVPTCGASRAAMLTGKRPDSVEKLRNDVFELSHKNGSNNDMPESFIETFRRNGYYTVGIGKISHSADGLIYGYEDQPSDRRELPNSWDELLFNSGKWGTGWNAFFGYADGSNRQSRDKQVKPYEKASVSDTGYVDGLTAQLAVSKLSELRDREEPFFMGVGFFKPHLPFTAPSSYWDLYDETKIPISNTELPKQVSIKSLHNSHELHSYETGDEMPDLAHVASDAYAGILKHSYYAAVSYVDAQIGRVLDELERVGLSENTIIVLWGDHGWHLGEDRIWGKHTLSEYSLRSAFMMSVPDVAARQIDDVVESVDIYPTLMDLCGFDLPYALDGESLVDYFKNSDKKDSSRVAFGYYNHGITMRTHRYRITKYYRDEEPTIELYDYQTDPLETENIASSRPQLVKKLLSELEKGNTGLFTTK